MSFRRAFSFLNSAGPSAVKSSSPTLNVRASFRPETTEAASSLFFTSSAMMIFDAGLVCVMRNPFFPTAAFRAFGS